MSSVSATATAAHIRDHRSVLATAEKRLLIAIARRLPHFVNSDHLSALGLTSIILTGACFALMSVTSLAAYGVPFALALNWFGDSLDGTVARVRNHQRPRYGYYVDHVIDIAGTTALMIGLACSTIIHPVLAMALLCAYLLLCGIDPVSWTRSERWIRCPEWPRMLWAGEPGDSSLKNSKTAQCAWSSTRGRPSARSRASSI
jgi:phosphatidylglycerophosphate synthase